MLVLLIGTFSFSINLAHATGPTKLLAKLNCTRLLTPALYKKCLIYNKLLAKARQEASDKSLANTDGKEKMSQCMASGTTESCKEMFDAARTAAAADAIKAVDEAHATQSELYQTQEAIKAVEQKTADYKLLASQILTAATTALKKFQKDREIAASNSYSDAEKKAAYADMDNQRAIFSPSLQSIANIPGVTFTNTQIQKLYNGARQSPSYYVNFINYGNSVISQNNSIISQQQSVADDLSDTLIQQKTDHYQQVYNYHVYNRAIYHLHNHVKQPVIVSPPPIVPKPKIITNDNAGNNANEIYHDDANSSRNNYCKSYPHSTRCKH